MREPACPPGVTPSRMDPALPDASWGSWRLESGSRGAGGASLWNRWKASHGVGMCAEKMRQSGAGVVLGGFLDRKLICLKTVKVAGKGGLSSSYIGRDWGSSSNSWSFQGPKSVTWGHIVAPTSLDGTRSSCIGSPQIPVSPLTPFLPGLQGLLAAHTFFPNPLSKLEEPPLRGLREEPCPPA